MLKNILISLHLLWIYLLGALAMIGASLLAIVAIILLFVFPLPMIGLILIVWFGLWAWNEDAKANRRR
jgi:hypothetical protein